MNEFSSFSEKYVIDYFDLCNIVEEHVILRTKEMND